MNFSLRTTLGASFVILVLSVTGISSAIGVVQARNETADSLLGLQAGTGQGVSSAIATFLDEAGQSLSGVAALLPSNSLKPQVNAAVVNGLLDPVIGQSHSYHAILVLNGNGQVVHVRPNIGELPDREWLEGAAVKTARTTLARALELGPEPGATHWATPVLSTRADVEPFLLVGLLDRNHLLAQLLTRIPLDAEASLVLQDGVVLVSTFQTPGSTLSDAWEPWSELQERGRADQPVAPPGGGAEALATMNEVGSYDASIMLLGSAEKLHVLQQQIGRSATITAGLLAAVALAFGFVVAVTITRPLKGVELAARNLSQGDLSARAAAKGSWEVRSLANEFNRMAVALQRERGDLLALQRGLESRVQERTRELEQKNRLLDEFAHVVSHDLKAPLRGIRLHAQLLAEELGAHPPKAMREHIDLVAERVLRMDAMINNILEYSRAGRANEPLAETDLHGLVTEAWGLAHQERGFRLDLKAPRTKITVRKVQLLQVFQNLLSNGVKHHHRKHGTVRVRLGIENHEIRAVVEDDGPGIPAEARERIFELFGTRDRSKPESTGVGLAITKRIIEAQGGRVGLTSTPGIGTRFNFTWPLGAATANPSSPASAPAAPAPRAEKAHRNGAGASKEEPAPATTGRKGKRRGGRAVESRLLSV